MASPIPALPVSGEPPAGGPPGVLAACDGSDGSLWALDRAMTEAELFGLPLYVLAVVNPSPTGYPPGMAELVRRERRAARREHGGRAAPRGRHRPGGPPPAVRRRARRCTWCSAT